jgi:hypothetical protein
LPVGPFEKSHGRLTVRRRFFIKEKKRKEKMSFYRIKAMLRSGVGGLAQAAKRAAVASGTAPVTAIVRGLSGNGASAGDVYARTGLDPGLFKGRKAVIYKPPKTATQNGKHNGQDWKIQ